MITLQHFDDVAVLHFSGGAEEARALGKRLSEEFKDGEFAIVLASSHRPGELPEIKKRREQNAHADTVKRHAPRKEG